MSINNVDSPNIEIIDYNDNSQSGHWESQENLITSTPIDNQEKPVATDQDHRDNDLGLSSNQIITHESGNTLDAGVMGRSPTQKFRAEIGLDNSLRYRLGRSVTMERSIFSSALGHVEIVDEEGTFASDDGINHKKLHQEIVRQDNIAKTALGWVYFERKPDESCVKRFLRTVYNCIYPVFVSLLLFSFYVVSMILCVSYHDNDSISEDGSQKNGSDGSGFFKTSCDSMFSKFVVHFIINYILYLALVWYTRYHRSEKLYVVLEKVLVRAAKSQIGNLRAPKIVRQIKLFNLFILLVGIIVWITCVTSYLIAERVKCVLSTKNAIGSFFHEQLTSEERNYVTYGLEALMFAGGLFYNLICLALLMHYYAFCTITTFNIQCLVSDLHQRSMSLANAIRDAQQIHTIVQSLNGFPSKVVSVVLLLALDQLIYQFYEISQQEVKQNYIQMSIRWCCIVQWLVILTCVFVPACKVSENGRQLRNVAAEMRAFGYPNTITSDLDSFITYLNIIRTQPKLFSIEVSTSWVAASYVVVFVALMMLSKLTLAD